MFPKRFEYYRPKEMADALRFMSSHAECKVIAGGQSLVPMLKLRIASPAYIVDIGGFDGLRYIKVGGAGELRIGALTTHSEVEESALVKGGWPVLSVTASNIADTQIRNRGTVGGSVCHADPAADYLPTMLALGARVSLRSEDGTRIIPLEEFLLGPFTTAIGEAELLEEVVIPPYKGKAGFEKFSRREGDIAVVNAAALLDLSDGDVAAVRVAVGGMGPTATLLPSISDDLAGRKFDEAMIVEAAERAIEYLDPPSDVHGSSGYRREVAKVVVKRLLLGLRTGGA